MGSCGADPARRLRGLSALLSTVAEAPRLEEAFVRRIVSVALETQSRRLQGAAVELVDAQRPPQAVPLLIQALRSDKAEVRRRANSLLQRISDTNQSFPVDGSATEREEGVVRWQVWWEQQTELPKRERTGGAAITGGPGGPGGPGMDLAEQARDLKWRGLDIALLLDSTGSMAGLLRAAKQVIDEVIAELGSPLPSLRISLYTYRDFGDNYVFYGTPLTYDVERLPGFLQSFVHGQGGDIPEAVYDTVSSVMRDLNWRKDSNKVLIYAGDAPHHPEQDAAFVSAIRQWATPGNRAVMHALFTDTNRRSMDIARRRQREDPEEFEHPYFEIYGRTAKEGRGRAVLLSDESTLIKEILVLAFGPAWRTDIETFLDFKN